MRFFANTQNLQFGNAYSFFSDIVGFTDISSKLDPHKVANLLDRLYNLFDELSDKVRFDGGLCRPTVSTCIHKLGTLSHTTFNLCSGNHSTMCIKSKQCEYSRVHVHWLLEGYTIFLIFFLFLCCFRFHCLKNKQWGCVHVCDKL